MAGDQKVRFRAGGYQPNSNAFVSILTLVATIGLWQLAASLGWVSTQFASSPQAIVKSLHDLAVSGELWLHLTASLQRLVIGWVIGTIAGIIVGVLLGLFSIARSAAFVLQAGNLYATDDLLAGIVVLSLLGLTVSVIVGLLERVLLRWR